MSDVVHRIGKPNSLATFAGRPRHSPASRPTRHPHTACAALTCPQILLKGYLIALLSPTYLSSACSLFTRIELGNIPLSLSVHSDLLDS